MRYSALLIYVCLGSCASDAAWHEFGVDGHAVLCVPESDMDPDLLIHNDETRSLQIAPGRTPGFGFRLTSRTVQSFLPEFKIFPELDMHPYVNNLSGSIGFLDIHDQTRFGPSMRARDVEDIWRFTGRCARAQVNPVAGTSLYEVKCAPEDDYGGLWNSAPESGKEMPDPNDLVSATCRYERLQLGPYAGNALQTCSRVTIIDRFIVDYRFQKGNAGMIRQIDSLLKGKIAEWQNNCSRTEG